MLQGIDLRLQAGELLLLAGPSGSGKSTLARALAGFLVTEPGAELQGRVQIAGAATGPPARSGQDHPVGLLLPEPASQLFQTRVDAEIAFGPRNLGLSNDEVRSRVERAARDARVSHLLDRRPDELSGGEKQRVALAAVLAMETRCLILDEPFASLDQASTRAFADVLARLKTAGRTLVVAEHRTEPVLPLADRVLLLEEGRAAAFGPTAEVMADQERLTRLGIRYSRSRTAAAWTDWIQPRISLDTDAQGEQVPLIRIRDLRAGHGRRQVLRGVDLTVHRGEVLALVGPNGCGKTTLARAVAGLHRPRSGSIRRHVRRKPGVGFLLQDPSRQLLFLTVREEVELGPRNMGRHEEQTVETLLAEQGLASLADRPVLRLSTGERHRTALASVLVLAPELIILDEPTRGQDWRHLGDTLRRLRAATLTGTAVLLITHDPKLVHRFADRLAVMDQGRILRIGPLRRRGEAA